MFRRREAAGQIGPGVAIGDRVLDLSACARAGFIPSELDDLGRLRDEAALNHLLAGGRDRVRAWRRWLVEFLDDDNAAAKRHAAEVTLPQSDVHLLVPVRIGDYSDFYASIHHATNVGSMFRPDNPLLPNYKYVPIGYHGRSSSIVASGTAVKRPSGQMREDQNAP